MLMLMTVALAVVLLNFVYFRIRHDARTALATSVVLGFCFPAFWEVKISGVPIAIQSATAMLCMAGYLLTGGSIRFRLNFIDLAIGGMVLVQVLSDALTHGGGLGAIAVAYGEWMLVYATGRYGFGSYAILRLARPHLLGFTAISVFVFAFDTFKDFNLAHWVTEYFTDWEGVRSAKRFGLIRSSGLASHPIFFSAMMMSLLPLVIASLKPRGATHNRGVYFTASAILASFTLLLSRGAFLSIAISSLGLAAMNHRRVLYGTMAMLLVAATWVGANWDRAEKFWYRTGGHSDQKQRVVTINSENKLHSSSLARLRLYDVYGKAAMNAGLFGYGSAALSGFPPKIPFLPAESAATKTVWTVENSYLLVLLRLGWIGLTLFVCLVLSPFLTFLTTKDLYVRDRLQIFVASAGSIAILIFTVYSDYQIIGPYLYLLGTIAALSDSRIGGLDVTAS